MARAVRVRKEAPEMAVQAEPPVEARPIFQEQQVAMEMGAMAGLVEQAQDQAEGPEAPAPVPQGPPMAEVVQEAVIPLVELAVRVPFSSPSVVQEHLLLPQRLPAPRQHVRLPERAR